MKKTSYLFGHAFNSSFKSNPNLSGRISSIKIKFSLILYVWIILHSSFRKKNKKKKQKTICQPLQCAAIIKHVLISFGNTTSTGQTKPDQTTQDGNLVVIAGGNSLVSTVVRSSSLPGPGPLPYTTVVMGNPSLGVSQICLPRFSFPSTREKMD